MILSANHTALFFTYCKQAKIRQLLNQIRQRQAAIAWLWRWSKIESQCTLNGLSPGVAKLFLARIWSIPSVFFFTCKLCLGDHESWALVNGNHMRQMITLNVPLRSLKAWLDFVLSSSSCFFALIMLGGKNQRGASPEAASAGQTKPGGANRGEKRGWSWP